MHDLPKEAIRFTDFIKIKIMDFLTQDFLNIMPTELNQIYKFGIFYEEYSSKYVKINQIRFCRTYLQLYEKL